MNPERLCPRCKNPVPLLAAECVFCHSPMGSDQPAEEPRYQVVRMGQTPVETVPEEVRRLDESSKVYYCKLGGQTVGPVTAADIRDAFSKGQIDGQASVGIQGRKEWYPIRALPQFSHMITGVGPVSTVRSPPASTGPGALPPPGLRPVPGLAGPATRAEMGRPPTPPPRHVDDGPGRRGPEPAVGLMAWGTSRNDGTLLVAPLPPPELLMVGSSTGQVTDPMVAAWQREVRIWRRRAIVFGIMSGFLLLASAALVGLLASQ